MLKWLTGKKKHEEKLPVYSRLKSISSRGLPSKLADQEASGYFSTEYETRRRKLLDPDRIPRTYEPLFTELFRAKEGGVLTIELPDLAGGCLPVFSSALRAGDYAQTLIPARPSLQYLVSSAEELIEILRDLEETGVESFTIDRCPRCDIFAVIDSDSVKTADDLLTLRAHFKAKELARMDLYFAFALESANAGELLIARDVALEAVGHVSPEDPRAHMLLGQLGVELRDRKLVQEAKAFLSVLDFDEWVRKLEQSERSSSPDYAFDV